MNHPLLITFLVLVAIALGAAGLLGGLGALGGSVDDPAVAACRRPPTTISVPRVLLDHREAVVRFTCNKARLSGTLYLPIQRGRYPAVVWVHGSGEQPRLSYGPLVASYVEDGHFNLVTADAVGAVEAVRSASTVDSAHVGFVGASVAGWIRRRRPQRATASERRQAPRDQTAARQGLDDHRPPRRRPRPLRRTPDRPSSSPAAETWVRDYIDRLH